MPTWPKRPRFSYDESAESTKRPHFEYVPDPECQARRPRFEYQTGSYMVPEPLSPTGRWLGRFIPIYLDKCEKPFGV